MGDSDRPDPACVQAGSRGSWLLKVLLKVHVGIERRDLVGVTVEHQRFSHEKLADAALCGLVSIG